MASKSTEYVTANTRSIQASHKHITFNIEANKCLE
jgi:hypothetical protein